MQAAFKYREITAFAGMEAEPSSLQVSGVGALKNKGSDSLAGRISLSGDRLVTTAVPRRISAGAN